MSEKQHSTLCTNCGAPLDIDPNAEVVKCEYCETVYPVSDYIKKNETVIIKEITVHEEKKKSKSKKYMVLTCLSLLFSYASVYSEEKSLVAFAIALVQALLFFLVWLKETNKINMSVNKTFFVAVAVVLYIPFLIFFPTDVENEDGSTAETSIVITEDYVEDSSEYSIVTSELPDTIS